MVERLWPYLRQAIEKLAWEMLPGESLLLHVTRQHAIFLPLWQQCAPCTVLLAEMPVRNRSSHALPGSYHTIAVAWRCDGSRVYRCGGLTCCVLCAAVAAGRHPGGQ
jgi:hypothetical protein